MSTCAAPHPWLICSPRNPVSMTFPLGAEHDGQQHSVYADGSEFRWGPE